MIPYQRDIEPPAPFLDVAVEHPATRQLLPFSAKLDTGADISAIPLAAVEQLRLLSVRSILVEGYDSQPVPVPSYAIALNIANARFRMEVIAISEPYVLVGRDVLNYFYTRLNGPDLTFDLSLSSPA
jgi:hypothetical protein